MDNAESAEYMALLDKFFGINGADRQPLSAAEETRCAELEALYDEHKAAQRTRRAQS